MPLARSTQIGALMPSEPSPRSWRASASIQRATGSARRHDEWSPRCGASLTREPMPPTTFLPDEHFDGVVELRDIPFHSLCEHHLLPFRGVAHISYLPSDRVVGISTLPRVVDHFAHGLQMQERLTEDIAGLARHRARAPLTGGRARGGAPLHVPARHRLAGHAAHDEVHPRWRGRQAAWSIS